MPLSTLTDTNLNKLMFGKTAFTGYTTLYFGLSTTTPVADGTNVTEPSGGSYARVAVTNNTTNFVAATSQPGTGQAQANGTAITCPTATGSWGTCTYVVIYDAATSGNMLAFYALTTAQTITTGGDCLPGDPEPRPDLAVVGWPEWPRGYATTTPTASWGRA